MNRLGRSDRRPLAVRFAERVDVNGPTMPHMTTPCHVWTGAKEDEYGSIRVDGRSQRAHRVAFLLKWGRWPEPFACHHCDNPPCVRWDHLFEGTAADNARDMAAKGRGVAPITDANREKTHCVNGHPFDESNTYLHANTGNRVCRACGALRARRRWVPRPTSGQCECGHDYACHFGRGRNRQCNGAGYDPRMAWKLNCRCGSFRLALLNPALPASE